MRCCTPLDGQDPALHALLAARLRALGDPTRLAIVARLAAAARPVCACEIGEGFAQGQPTISHHLRVLRQAGLVTARRRGTWIHYEADAGALAEVAGGLEELVAARAQEAA
jgi:ArsR family transcriptional regulator